MADAHNTTDHDSPHEGPIKTPKQLIWAVIYAFVVPIILIILLVNFVAADKKAAPGTEALTSPEAIAARIQPVAGAPDIKDMSDVTTLKTGEQVYGAVCMSCHGTGLGGAPKLGDAGAWAPRIGQGHKVLLQSALKGKNGMPPQGGGDFSDFEIERAVVFMANKGGGKLAEPVLAAASGAAPASAAADAAASAPAAAAASAAK